MYRSSLKQNTSPFTRSLRLEAQPS